MTRSIRSLGTLLLVVIALGACTTRSVERPSTSGGGGLAGMAPMLSVERFLQAANARDYNAMAGLFGTASGPVEGDRREVEIRMATIAEILRHDDYEVVSEERAAGRVHPTNRVGVTLTRGNQVFRDVAFMVVQTERGGWLLEEIDLEAITGS